MSLGKVAVIVEANMAGFESDMGRAARLAEKNFKKMERDAKRMEAEMRRVGKAVGLAIVAGAGAAALAIKGAINAMDDMSKAAQRANMPTEAFSQLAYAGNLADVSAQDLTMAMGKLAKSMEAALDDSSAQAQAFRDLGIKAIDPLTGKLRDVKDVFYDLADAFKDGAGSAEVMGQAAAVAGRGFQTLIPMFKDGASGLRELAKESDRFGATLTEAAGEQAEQFNDDLQRLAVIAKGVARAFAAEMLPSLLRASQGMLDFMQASGGVGKIVDGITSAIGYAYEAIKALTVYVATRYLVTVGAAVAINVSLTASMGTATLAAVAMTAAMSALRIAAALLFGPVGIIALGVTTLYLMATAQTDAEKAADDHNSALDRINSTAKYSVDGALKIAGAVRIEAAAHLQAAKAILTKKLAAAGGDGLDVFGMASSAAARAIANQRKLLEQLEWQLVDVDAAIASLGVDKLGEGIRAQFDAALRPLDIADPEKKTKVKKEKKEKTGRIKLEDIESGFKEAQKAAIERNKVANDAYDIATRAQDQFRGQMSDMQFDIDMTKMSNVERERANAIRYAGVDAMSVEGQALGALAEKRHAALEAERNINDVKSAFKDFAVEAAMDFKSIGDAFENLVKRLQQKAMELLADKAIDAMSAMFSGKGKAGGTASGTASGGKAGWMQIAGQALMSYFGGGKAGGGPVSGSKLYEVGEGGKPEMFASGGRNYLIPGNDGTVTPASRGMAAPMGGMQIQFNVANYGNDKVSEPDITVEAGKMIVRLAVGEVARQAGRRGTPVNNAMRAGLATAGSLG